MTHYEMYIKMLTESEISFTEERTEDHVSVSVEGGYFGFYSNAVFNKEDGKLVELGSYE